MSVGTQIVVIYEPKHTICAPGDALSQNIDSVEAQTSQRVALYRCVLRTAALTYMQALPQWSAAIQWQPFCQQKLLLLLEWLFYSC